jgi:excisionase family DNA binding protein
MTVTDTATTPFIGPEELADRWGVNKKTILAHVADGTIPCTKLGRRWLIPLAWVEARETAGED